MSDYQCPYCKKEQNYDGDPLGDCDSTEVTCMSCYREFIVTASVHVFYEPSCKPEDHKWRDWDTPAGSPRMLRCITCGDYKAKEQT